MTTGTTQRNSCNTAVVAVVLLEGMSAPPGLARAAMRNGWAVLSDGVRDLRRARAAAGCGRAAYVVHVRGGSAAGIEAIALLRGTPRCAGVIAVGETEKATVEVAARAAGATCFLGESGAPEVFERAVAQVLCGQEGEPVRASAPERLTG